MNRLPIVIARLLVAAVLIMAAALPALAQSTQTSLGQHTVRRGDTLYCIGRAYGVLPLAIARANGLSATARLNVGQVLSIPAVQWTRIPSGPTCQAQFKSPYTESGNAVAPTPTIIAEPTSTPTPTPTSVGCSNLYTVQRGDTLFRIARRFGVTVAALQSANGLSGSLIYPGQVLCIPAAPPPGCPQGCISLPPCPNPIKGNVSFTTGEKIYHVVGGQFYDETIIDPNYGERWFCTEAEAIANGWRKSER